jgi:uncharacterized protein (DUF362 family)
MGAGVLSGSIAGIGFGCTRKNQSSITYSETAVYPSYKKTNKTSRVSLVKGDDRRKIIYDSMKNLESEIIQSIGHKKILIKPNLVHHGIPECATHPDAVRGVLDFLKPHINDEIMVGESTASRDFTTMDIFEDYGFKPIEKEYNIRLVDLNKEKYETRSILGENSKLTNIRIISQFLDPDIYIISVPRMKVHCHCYVTLSLKNTIMAAPVNDYTHPELWFTTGDKFAMHITADPIPHALYFNMFLLAHHVYPDLAVIDGFEGMETRGPLDGNLVDSHVAVTSLDALSADILSTLVMGLDPEKATYLKYMTDAGFGQGDMDKISVIGSKLSECIHPYKPDRDFMKNNA